MSQILLNLPSISLSSNLSLQIVLTGLFPILFFTFHPNISMCVFTFIIHSLAAVSLHVLVFLCFYSGSLIEHQFYHRLISLLHELACLLQWCCPWGYLVTICFPFRFQFWLFFCSDTRGVVMKSFFFHNFVISIFILSFRVDIFLWCWSLWCFGFQDFGSQIKSMFLTFQDYFDLSKKELAHINSLLFHIFLVYQSQKTNLSLISF